jgi:hypothetical protein
MGMSVSDVRLFTGCGHVRLFVEVRSLVVDVAVGGEIDVDGPDLVVVAARRERCEVVDVGSVLVCNRMCCLGCDLLGRAVPLRLVDAELPPLTTDGAEATHDSYNAAAYPRCPNSQ